MPRRRRVLHYREVPPYFIEPSPPEGATRSARRPAVGGLQPFFAKRLLKLLTPLFGKRLLKLLTFGRVTGGVNVTDRGLTAACTLRRMPASPREVGGAVGGDHRSPFTLGACEDTPRKKIVCPTQTPAPGLPPHPSAATRQNPAPDCPIARVRAAGRPQHSRTVLARATSRSPSLLV